MHLEYCTDGEIMTEGETRSTRLNSRWLLKLVIFAVVSAGFGAWGMYDAFIAYPKRGQRVAQFELLEYFDKSDAKGMLYRASVDDPAAEQVRLTEEYERKAQLTDIELARLSWLNELAKVANLTVLAQENTDMVSRPPAEQEDTQTWFVVPATSRDDLGKTLAGKKAPPPLSDLDIVFQYGIAAVGWGVCVLVLWRIMRSGTIKYRYVSEDRRLILPDGREITPSDIELVDKRDWHKFYVYLKLKDSGKEVKLDVLRFVPLEEWVLEMAKHVEGYEGDDEAPTEDDSENASETAESPA